MTPSSQFSTWLRRHQWLLAALLFVFFYSLPTVGFPLDRDHGVFLTIGRCILDGGVPYADCWDTKPPGIFFLFAGIAKLFGESFWGVRIFDLLWLLVFSRFLYQFGKRTLGEVPAALGTALHAVAYHGLGYRNTANPESFLMLFVVLGFLLAVRGRGNAVLNHAVAGCLMGAAFWFKFNALIFSPLLLALPFLALPYHERREGGTRRPGWPAWGKNLAAFAGGVGAMVAAGVLYFWTTGGLRAFHETFFEVVPRYVRMGYDSKPDFVWWFGVLQERVGFWTEVMLVVLLVICLRSKAEERRQLAPVLLAALIGLASAILQMRLWIYTFAPALPFLSLLWAYLAVWFVRLVSGWSGELRRRGMRIAQVAVWGLTAVVLVPPLVPIFTDSLARYRSAAVWVRDPEIAYRTYTWNALYAHWGEMMRVIDLVRGSSRSGEKIFVWGFEPLIYYKSGRRPASRFVTNMPLVAPWAPEEWRTELMSEFRVAPPEIFIVNRDDAVYRILFTRKDSEQSLADFPELDEFISQRYVSLRDFHAFHVFLLRN